MTKMMDIQCNVEFPTDALYMKHKRSGHTQFLDEATPLDGPGVPASAMPSKEFMEQVSRIEAKKEQPPAPSQHPTELPATKPLKLTYKYLGECPEHRAPVDTLEIDAAKAHYCIAYCSAGKHQIESREVDKL